MKWFSGSDLDSDSAKSYEREVAQLEKIKKLEETLSRYKIENEELKKEWANAVCNGKDQLRSMCEKLKAINKILEDAVKFYGREISGQQIVNEDTEQIYFEDVPYPSYFFGKKARQAQKQVEEIRGK